MKKIPNPKKKASELIDKYLNLFFSLSIIEAQCCALASIDEAIEYANLEEKILVDGKYITISKYLDLVKKEIEDYES